MPYLTNRMVTTIPIMHSILILLMKHPCGARRLDSAKESGVNSWTVCSLRQRQDLDTFRCHSDILLTYLRCSTRSFVAVTSCILCLIWMYRCLTDLSVLISDYLASYTYLLNEPRHFRMLSYLGGFRTIVLSYMLVTARGRNGPLATQYKFLS
jgi:hypothetical protein